MPSNIDEFERQLDEAFEKAKVQKFVELQKTITLKCYQYITADSRDVGLAYGSPVWTGRFRASFNASIDTPDFTVKPPHPEVGEGLRWPNAPKSPYNSQGVARAAAAIAGLAPFQTTVIANGLPYARRIEMGGFSLKAPSGVLNVVAAKVAKEFDGVVIA